MNRRIVITGAGGFLAKNLAVRLREAGHTVLPVTRDTSDAQFDVALGQADFVFHLAGANRPKDSAEFQEGNVALTRQLCKRLAALGRPVPVAYSSSTQATMDNPYGRSKRDAETVLERHGRETGSPVHLFRLTNVFGKWARPHYNSAVATFCHQVATGQPLTIHDPAAPVRLVYVDDVVDRFLTLLSVPEPSGFVEVDPVYETTVGKVADAIQGFADSRRSLVIPRVGTGLVRALYSTYLSHLPPAAFAYDVPRHGDARGVFVEMLKTPDSGQFSYFTAHPGVTRGEHYHHTKTEKFLVIKGRAHFGFRHIETDERHELVVEGGEGRIVETVPGWTHNITNVGEDELLVMLWANEIFDRSRPDTIAMKVTP